MSSQESQILLYVIAGVVALALLTQALVLVALFFVLRKTAASIHGQIEHLSGTVTPFINEAREVFHRVAPKIEQTSIDVAAITRTLRIQTDDAKSVAAEVIQNVRRQASRLDSVTSDLLDTADRASAFLSGSLAKPIRQISGVLAMVKAIVENLRAPKAATGPRPANTQGDRQMFV